MHFHFHGDLDGLQDGIALLAPELNISLDTDGYSICAEKKANSDLIVSLDGPAGKIVYSERCHFFRGLGLLVEQIREGEASFTLTEEPQFRMNGPMFDVSQGNSVLNIPTVKEILRQLSLMGLNMMMLYCEDSFEVKEQPYFGYMRGRYSEEEMRELDAYADSLGIEMIPCMQTLAHMPDTLRWKCFRNITDYDACMLVGEEKTYEFIEQMILAASRPFKTRKINICMDEAMQLGRGRYLDLNGYHEPSEIMREHLARVMQILNKHNLQPLMSDDMFFRVFGNRNYHNPDQHVPQHVRDMVPENMICCYWNYYHLDQADYERIIPYHFELTDKVAFMGGIWTWVGFSLAWEKTLTTTESALNACKKLGVRDIIATTWGDNGTEALITTTLIGCQLFAEHGYAKVFDYEKFKKRFAFCTGGVAEDFETLELLDKTPDTADMRDHAEYNTSKWLMWQDILTGLGDKNIEGVPMDAHYRAVAEKLKPAIGRNGRFDPNFAFAWHVAHVLSLKGEMGLRLTAAYKANDPDTLHALAEKELPDLRARVTELRRVHKRCWMRIYKPFGWDIMDMRYGTLLMRIESAIEQLSDYLAGVLPRIEELEEERLYFDGIPGPIHYMNGYGRIVSPSRIAADT